MPRCRSGSVKALHRIGYATHARIPWSKSIPGGEGRLGEIYNVSGCLSSALDSRTSGPRKLEVGAAMGSSRGAEFVVLGHGALVATYGAR